MKPLWLITIALLSGCTDNIGCCQSGAVVDIHPQLAKAHDMLREHYPEAVAAKTVIIEDRSDIYAYAQGDTMYLTPLWVETSHKNMKQAACIVAHEYAHIAHLNALNYEKGCLSTI